jgi:hypothetical protein
MLVREDSMARHDLRPLRVLGPITLRPEARRLLSTMDLVEALRLHIRNESASDFQGASCRYLGAYRSRQKQTFWIITEADQCRTTVLMPSEY